MHWVSCMRMVRDSGKGEGVPAGRRNDYPKASRRFLTGSPCRREDFLQLKNACVCTLCSQLAQIVTCSHGWPAVCSPWAPSISTECGTAVTDSMRPHSSMQDVLVTLRVMPGLLLLLAGLESALCTWHAAMHQDFAGSLRRQPKMYEIWTDSVVARKWRPSAAFTSLGPQVQK